MFFSYMDSMCSYHCSSTIFFFFFIASLIV